MLQDCGHPTCPCPAVRAGHNPAPLCNLLQDQMAIEDLRYFMAVGMGISHYHTAPVNTDVVLLVSGDTCERPAVLQRLHRGPGRLLCSAQCRQLPARCCPGCHVLLAQGP